MHATKPDGVGYRTKFKGHEISVFSTWTQDARLYIDGVCRDRSVRRATLQKTCIMSADLRIGADVHRVEVFAKALLSIRLQVQIDGRQVAGEVF